MDKKYAPIVFWGWNAKLDKKEIERQLAEFSEKGIGGVFVHARVGLDIEYLGDEWMDAYEFTIECCKKNGIDVWLYDEYGWPSGFAGGEVFKKSDDYKEKYVLSFCGTFDDLIKKGIKEEDIVGAYILEHNEFTKITDYKNGEFYFIYKGVNDYYVDVVDKEAMTYFFEYTIGKYKSRFGKYFGNIIKGVFTDEPHLATEGIHYGRFMPGEFFKNFGYSLDEALPYMFYDVGDYKKHRYNFWKNITKMFAEIYVGTYNEICKKNNLVLTGHFACEEGIVDQITASGGTMQLYEKMGQIGVDALGNRLVPAVVCKQAQSVANQINDGNVLCETYAGSSYEASLKDVMWIWGYLVSLGVNIPCLSISMYSIAGQRKRDYPLYFSYQMPWWEKSDRIFESMTRINNKLKEGVRKPEILVIHPLSSGWLERGFNIIENTMHISSEFRMLTETLIDLQKEFDYGDEELMKKYARVEGDKLIVGKCSYSKVILPYMTNISSNTVKLLNEFANNGGKIFVTNDYPKYIDGEKKNCKDLIRATFTINRKDMWRKIFRICGEDETCFLRPSIRFKQYGISVTRRNVGDKEIVFAVNLSRDETVKTRLYSKGKNSVVKQDIFGNEKKLFSEYNSQENVTYTEYNFAPQEVAFFTIDKKEEKVKNEKVVLSELLEDFDIDIGENTFVIDKVKFYINNELIGKEDFTIKQTESFYKKINGSKEVVNLRLEYLFNAKDVKGKVKLGIESLGGEVLFNGKKINSCGYFMDKDITTYDVTGMVKDGENIITVEKVIPPYYSPYLDNEVYQSISNVQCFPFYFENVYLSGDFDVLGSDFSVGDNCIWADNFSVAKKTEKKDLSDLLTKNMFFYCGKVVATKEIEIEDSGYRYRLDFKDVNSSIVVLYVNDKEVVMYDNNIDITDYLHKGKNKIKIVLYSTARNVLGAFHHIYGKHYYVGPSVFEGYKEWQDVVMFPEIQQNTWTDKYSFVPFGIKEIHLEKVKIW